MDVVISVCLCVHSARAFVSKYGEQSMAWYIQDICTFRNRNMLILAKQMLSFIQLYNVQYRVFIFSRKILIQKYLRIFLFIFLRILLAFVQQEVLNGKIFTIFFLSKLNIRTNINEFHNYVISIFTRKCYFQL